MNISKGCVVDNVSSTFDQLDRFALLAPSVPDDFVDYSPENLDGLVIPVAPSAPSGLSPRQMRDLKHWVSDPISSLGSPEIYGDFEGRMIDYWRLKNAYNVERANRKIAKRQAVWAYEYARQMMIAKNGISLKK